MEFAEERNKDTVQQVARKPAWLNKKIRLRECQALKRYLKERALSTVCQEALCPNISECFERKQATFLILGDICTRRCSFCNIKKGKPHVLDYTRISRIKDAVRALQLRHAVITSVTRDDLEDGGAEYFARAVRTLRQIPELTIELLIPDFNGSELALGTVAGSGPDIIGHNIETVPRLYPAVRKDSDFQRSLRVLAFLKKTKPALYTKSGIMLGLGEKREEVLRALNQLRTVDCNFLSIGQYLQPSLQHYPVQRYAAHEEFAFYKQEACKRGFTAVASGPYVRSSYLAETYLAHTASGD